MRILFFDLLPISSHDNLNTNLIRCLESEYDLTLFCRQNLYKISKSNKIVYNNNLISKLDLFIRLKSLVLIIKYLFIKDKRFDIIFVPTFETITFTLFSLLCNKKIFIIHHLNIDELENKTKAFFFSLYKNKVNHLVFDNDFKIHLKKNHSVTSFIDVFNHPITELDIENHYNPNDIKLCVALSQSNDENIIQKIIEYNESTNFLFKNNIQLIIRSKSINYNKNNLKVYNNHLSNIAYQKLIKDSFAVMLLHPVNFHYRVSGVLFDSLANNKFVISSNTLHANKISKQYNSICKIAYSSVEFFREIQELKYNSSSLVEFKRFKSNYSKINFDKKLKSCVCYEC